MLFLLIGGSMTGFCQVPGYLGKKLSLQGEFHSFPALDGPTSNNRGLQTYDEVDGGRFGLNWSAGARLGYVVSRQSQILVSFDYFKTGMNQTVYFPDGGFNIGERNVFFNLTGLSFGVGQRKFRSSKGGLAPMGMYTGYSLNATMLNGKVNREFSSGTEIHGTEPKHIVPSLGYEFGTNIVVKDRLLVNVGAKLNFALSPRAVGYVIAESLSWDPYSNEKGLSFAEGNTENFKTIAASRYALHSVFMIYLGVGLIQ